MNRPFPILAMYLVLTAAAPVPEPAESVSTTGTGELRRASEVMIAPKAKNISARIPGVINKGEVIQIQYEDSGTVADSFMVTGISVLDHSCTIESMRAPPNGPAVSDVILVKPCTKLK